jgi:hypothetical protein
VSILLHQTKAKSLLKKGRAELQVKAKFDRER